MVARSIHFEIREGRGINNEYIYLDLRHLGEEKIKTRLPQIREIAIHFAGVDPVHDPIPIRPTVHYTMGGIDVNIKTETMIPGIYAAGECSCVSVHGANRLGGNSLLETVVFGPVAGREALKYSKTNELLNYSIASIQAEEDRLNLLLNRTRGERAAAIRVDMEKTMVKSFGIFRTEKSMQEGLYQIIELKKRYENVIVEDKGQAYNLDLVRVLELGYSSIWLM